MTLRSRAVLLLVGLASCSPEPSSDDEIASDSASSDTSESASDSDSETSGDEGGWERVWQADESQGALMSVWGSSPDEVYVVGGQPDPQQGTVLRFDGSQWMPEQLPVDTPMLHWVYGVDDRVWAVGRLGAILVREGEVWTAEASPSDRILWGIWGASADELWAVGGDGVSDAPVLLRREGASESWTQVDLPALSVDTHGLFKIWGSAADDVWIVGDVGASLHWDGSEWTDHSTSDNIDLISLWGTPSEGIVAVGGRASGRIVRLGGASWSGETLESPGLNGVWVDPSGPITVVGNMGTIFSLAPGGFEVTPEDSGTALVLHATFGFAGGPRYAVGGSLLAPPPYTGVVLASPE
ncbi:hypothetical protein ACNOYE_23940 [Nannocystaceae bacterium ST9]